METKLLPCLKCGSQNIAVREWWNSLYEIRYFAECYDCGCLVGFMADPSGWVGAAYHTEAEAIEAWNTRQGKTCDGCKHLATSMRVDYHIDPCCECVRNAPDLYEPKEATDVD